MKLRCRFLGVETTLNQRNKQKTDGILTGASSSKRRKTDENEIEVSEEVDIM